MVKKSSLIYPLECAYFSMEIMLESEIPSYAGGLGVLAGDILRSAADMEIPMVGVSLVYNGTSFSQEIEPDGSQKFEVNHWQKNDKLTHLPNRIELQIDSTPVQVGLWRYDIVGVSGFVVPVYLLDTDVLDNGHWARAITQNLYEGEYRLPQEVLLGIGGVKMLRNLGYQEVNIFQMNEGHASFVPLALEEELGYNDQEVKKKCVFVTHTPIPEGHDQFDYQFAWKIAGAYLPWHIKDHAGENSLHMTRLGMSLSKYSIAVSKMHEETSSSLFPEYKINSITNGVHHRTWIAPEMQNLLDKFIPEWITWPEALKEATEKLHDEHLWKAHEETKFELIEYVNRNLTSIRTEKEQSDPPNLERFDTHTLTLALARRPVPYKRPLLLYHDVERLLRIGEGKLQIIQCGKAFPGDPSSQGFVHEIIEVSKKFRGRLKVVYLENYSPKIARLLVGGVDVWVNTPRRPLEASGTSGMKAAMNGVLNLSVLDGWWIEGYKMEHMSGWPIAPENRENSDEVDANSIYDLLENTIIPMYYTNRWEWTQRMKHAISLGAYFNTHRVLQDYKKLAWNSVLK